MTCFIYIRTNYDELMCMFKVNLNIYSNVFYNVEFFHGSELFNNQSRLGFCHNENC